MIGGEYTLIDTPNDTDLLFQKPRTEFTQRPYNYNYMNTQNKISSYEMTYPGYLERRPIPNNVAVKTEYSPEYISNKYQNNPWRNNPNDHNCVAIYEHFKNCELCNKISSADAKLYIVIIAFLLFIIVFLLLKKRRTN